MHIETNKLYSSPEMYNNLYTGSIVHAGICQDINIENPILVFQNGDIQYYETIVFALRKQKEHGLIVILQKGGQNCHLLINAREKYNITILHLPNALQLLAHSTHVTVECKTGKIYLGKDKCI